MLFCTGVDDGSGMVREAGEVDAVFLAHECLCALAFLGVIEEEGVIGARGQAEFARVVEVEGRYGGFGLGKFELLAKRSASWHEEYINGSPKVIPWLVGRSL